MKRNMKSFISGMVIMFVLMSAVTVFGAPVSKSIQAMVDTVKTIVFNGNNVAVVKGSQVITYNNVTYVPITAVSDAICKNVQWDSKTGKLDINGIKISNAERDSIYKALELNIKHFNDQDIDGFIGDFSSAVDKNMLDITRNGALQQFSYKITEAIKNKTLVGYDGKVCEVRVLIEVKQGAALAGKVTAVQKLVKENGKWKISFSYNEKMEK